MASSNRGGNSTAARKARKYKRGKGGRFGGLLGGGPAAKRVGPSKRAKRKRAKRVGKLRKFHRRGIRREERRTAAKNMMVRGARSAKEGGSPDGEALAVGAAFGAAGYAHQGAKQARKARQVRKARKARR